MNYRILSEQEKEELLPKFSIWRKTWIEDNHKVFMTIQGIPSETKGFYYKAFGDSKIAIEHSPIPPDYRKQRRTTKFASDDWVKEFYFNKFYDPKDFEGQLIPNKWISEVMPFWLNINRVLMMEPNKIYKVLLLDRNCMDNVYGTKRKSTLVIGNEYTPKVYFKNCWANIYRKNNSDLKMGIKYSFDDDYSNFEFDIEYKKGRWYPLKNGFNQVDNKNWNEYPTYYYIGWRGPMILWEDIEKLPKIVHYLE